MNPCSRIACLVILSCLTAMPVAAQQNWVRMNIPKTDSVFYGLTFSDRNTGFAVGTDGVMYRTTDGGVTWAHKPLPTTLKLTAVTFPTAAVGFIVGEEGTILKSTDGGDNWTPIDAKTKKTLFAVHFFDEDSGFVAGQGGEFLYTKDKGATWQARDAKFGPNNIYSISFPTPRIGYICGNAGNVSRSLNGGATWQSQDSKFGLALLAISFGNATTGTMVGEGGAIRHTTDAGKTWIEQFANVPLSSYPLHAVQHLDSNAAFIVGWLGVVLFKTEKESYWTAFENSYSEPLTAMHFFNQREGYVAGWKSSVLKTTNGAGTVTGLDPVPRDGCVMLFQNAPNPVRLDAAPSTQIRFEVTTPGRTSLRVYSALGVEVATVLDEDLRPGRYIRNWNIPRIPPGTYYYLLRNGNSAISRSLTIMR